MSTFYPQEPGKNAGNPPGPPPTDPYGTDPTMPSSRPYRPPSQPYGPAPAQPNAPPPYGAGPVTPIPQYGPVPAQSNVPPPYRVGPVTPIPPYQQYPAGWQPPYSHTPGNYSEPPPAPRSRSHARLLMIALVALVIIASIGAIVVPYATTQIDHTNATATASTHATTVASDATGTVVTQQAHLTATTQAIAQATATVVAANPDPYPPYQGMLVVLDKTPAMELGNTCSLQNNVLHATVSQTNTLNNCWGGPSYDNFVYEIAVTIVKGDCGGIIFREDATEGNKDYAFDICQNGAYSIDIDQGAALNYDNIKFGTTTPGLHRGLNQTNLVAVVAQGQNFSLYVNKQLVTTFSNPIYGSGRLGVAVWDDTNPTDVSFANQRVWKL